MKTPPAQRELEDALTAPGSAHHEYEVNMLGGHRDEEWPGWYAAYVMVRLGDFTMPPTLARLLEAAPQGGKWSGSATAYVLQQLRSGLT